VTVCLFISLPVYFVAGIAIKIDSPGSILFMQERCGENVKTFRVFKLRTMTAGAE
jgi:lipopolysaccharide/colanic/teichoic acid biosynthesis glycosyltransferase